VIKQYSRGSNAAQNLDAIEFTHDSVREVAGETLPDGRSRRSKTCPENGFHSLVFSSFVGAHGPALFLLQSIN
jgi:hypothetical protein